MLNAFNSDKENRTYHKYSQSKMMHFDFEEIPKSPFVMLVTAKLWNSIL